MAFCRETFIAQSCGIPNFSVGNFDYYGLVLGAGPVDDHSKAKDLCDLCGAELPYFNDVAEYSEFS